MLNTLIHKMKVVKSRSCSPGKKYLYIAGFTFAMLFGSVSAIAQTTLFTENFESYGQINLPTTGTTWRTRVVSGSNVWEIWNVCAASGSYGMDIYNGGSGCSYDNTSSRDLIAWYGTKIDATNYNTLKLNFKWKASGESTYDYGKVVRSTNGTSWTAVSATQYWNHNTYQTVANLDLSAADGTQFYIGFEWINDGSAGSSPGFCIDDVSITGTPNCSTPTVQASSLTITPTCTQATVAWTNGNGTKRIVKCNTANSWTAPADGTDPSANPVYGGGEQVVYNSTGSTVVVTGLTKGTTYWFKVYDANCSSTNVKFATAVGANNPLSGTTTNVPGTPGTPVGTANPCPTVSQTYSISPVATATSYTWTVPTGWSISAGASTATITVTTGTNGQNGNITVKAINACGTGASSPALAVTITVSSPVAGYDQYLCAGTLCTTMAATGTGTWTQISGPNQPSIQTPGSTTSIIGYSSGACPGGSGGTQLTSGTYVFRWTSTCGGAYDDMLIFVK